ncbi:MAG: DUF6538 domain-containing protein [Actinomycetota bacterium]
MGGVTKINLKHVIQQRQGYYYFRRIPKDVLPFYEARGEYGSGFLQRTLGTGDPRQVPGMWARVHAEVEAEWDRIREHLRTVSAPQTLDQIDEATAKALIWKCWLAWVALGFPAEKTMEEFGAWALRVVERLPAGIEYMTPRAVRDWHDDLDAQPQRRILTPFAVNAMARELPGMTPALNAMPVLDLEKNPAFAAAARKPKMLREVMDAWYANHRRKNLKMVTDKDGTPVKVADKNYDVPFKIARDVLGETTFVSHVSRDDILDLVDVICHLPKGAHDIHDRDGTPYRDLAAAAKAALEEGDEVEFNADSSLNKYLGGITTLFTFALNNTWLKEHPANGIKILGGNASKRRALTAEELGKLFHAGYRPQVNSWVPLLLLTHGCRTNEIAQLDVADVIQRPSGLWCLNLTEEGDKSLKTEASIRTIPIHRKMIDLGFLAFVEERRAAGQRKLFNVAGARAWDSIREDMYAMFAATGVYKQGEVVPYSLRHTWTAWMTDAGVEPEKQEAIGGWSLSGGARKRYGRKQGTKVVRYEPEALVDDLNRLDYGTLFVEAAPEGWDMARFERVQGTRG